MGAAATLKIEAVRSLRMISNEDGGQRNDLGPADRRSRAGVILRTISRSYVWRILLAALVTALAAYLLYRTAHQYSLAAVADSLGRYSLNGLLLVGVFGAGSYACLTAFDALALRYVRRDVPYPYVAMTSFISLSLGHNIGFSALSSGAIRFRMYTRYRLSALDVAKVILFCAITVGLGLTMLAGLALSGRPQLAADLFGIDQSAAWWIGVICLCVTMAYVVICGTVRNVILGRRWQVRLPSPQLAVGQLVVGTLNFAMVAACLYEALAGTSDVSYLGVAAIYVLANIATIVSHVPGGLGVVETVVLMFVPGEPVLAALIVFRLVYFVIPLILGTIVFCILELFRPRRRKEG